MKIIITLAATAVVLATASIPLSAQGCWTEANCKAKCRELVAAGKSKWSTVPACYAGMPCTKYPKKCK
jgi:hypothetical protein